MKTKHILMALPAIVAAAVYFELSVIFGLAWPIDLAAYIFHALVAWLI